MPHISTILFDLDGTLTDSHPGITASIRYALAQLNVAAPDDLSWCVGPPLRDNFAQLLGTRDPQLLDQAIFWYRERFATVGMFENAVYPGMHETLAALTERGFRLFVATSKPAVYARAIVAHFDLLRSFAAIYGSELDGLRADKTDLLRYLLEQEQLDPAGCAMIGDRRHDIVAAKALGLHAVGVRYGYGSLEELTAAGADDLAVSPAALLDLSAFRQPAARTSISS
jgi:phosphoglycolate phosphatase